MPRQYPGNFFARQEFEIMSDKWSVPGFLLNGIHVGIKDGGRKDLALIYANKPVPAAAVFTTNDFKAPPVLLSMERIRKGFVQAVLINSGNANAATGHEGYRDAVAMSGALAKELDIDPDRVLVASTGKIGDRLPIDKIVAAVPVLVSGLAKDRLDDAEAAIMTTDKFPKIESRQVSINGKTVTLCGLAKGAGMIEPNMATMLTFILTDAAISTEILDRVFRECAADSFNAISVDGCMSTNDMALIMASGVAGNDIIAESTPAYTAFKSALLAVMIELAKAIVRDGEGATKVLEIVVEQGATRDAARGAAYAIARSNLVKTAFFGKDPNWGRIISAAGSIGLKIDPERMEVYLDDLAVFKAGGGVVNDRERLMAVMQREEIRVTVRLGQGAASFRVFASDLSHDYIHINADYHT